MGRSGFVGGSVYAQNLQAGSATATLGGTGTDTVTVTFGKRFKAVPKVSLGNASTKALTGLRVGTITNSGCVLTLINATSLTGSASIHYIAMDDSYR